jgi:hypothetical protein
VKDPATNPVPMPPVSIIVEWENALLCDSQRPAAMLRELRRQATEITCRQNSGPFELLIVHDVEQFSAEGLTELLNQCVGGPDDVIRWRLIPTSESRYYSNKDLGVKHAAGEIVLFLDSDVIPEPGWLERILSVFRDPSIQIVAGSAFIDPADFLGKVFALTWFFPLRKEDGPVEQVDTFFANNFAMRKSLYDRHPFPELPGYARGSCLLLAAELAKANVAIYQTPGARVAHPAPSGAKHLIKRAVAQGRDDVLREHACGTRWPRSWLHSFIRLPWRCATSTWGVCTKFYRVGLNPLMIPAALLLSWSYYLLCWSGEEMTHLGLRAIHNIRV